MSVYLYGTYLASHPPGLSHQVHLSLVTCSLFEYAASEFYSFSVVVGDVKDTPGQLTKANELVHVSSAKGEAAAAAVTANKRGSISSTGNKFLLPPSTEHSLLICCW